MKPRHVKAFALSTFAVSVFGLPVPTPIITVGPALAVEATAGKERLEVSGIKAVRPYLVKTLDALKRNDIPAAKAAFEDYNSAWNGIEVYINTRSRELYQAIELNLQKNFEQQIDKPGASATALGAIVTDMITRYDQVIALVEAAPPLNRFYDEVARLRIVRAHLREVLPALKAGNLEKARKSYTEFDNTWDSIEDLIKARSADAYVEIEKGMLQIEQALMPAKPDTEQLTKLVNDVLTQYNAQLAEITKDARAQK